MQNNSKQTEQLLIAVPAKVCESFGENGAQRLSGVPPRVCCQWQHQGVALKTTSSASALSSTSEMYSKLITDLEN